MNAQALDDWDFTACDMSEYYSKKSDPVYRELFSEHAALCNELYQQSPMTKFEASVRAWAHLIRQELSYREQHAQG